MGRDVAVPGDRDDGAGEQTRDPEQRAAPVPPRRAGGGVAGAPQRHGAETKQQHTGRNCQEAGEVVAGRPDLPRVVQALDAGGDPEDAERERQRPPPSSSQQRVRPRGEAEQRERHEAADDVVPGRGARLRLQVVVVEDVGGYDGERAAEQDGLTTPTRPRARLAGRGVDGGGGGGGGMGIGEPHPHRRAGTLVRHRFGVKRLPAPVSSQNRSGSLLRMALPRTTVSFGAGPAGLVMSATPPLIAVAPRGTLSVIRLPATVLPVPPIRAIPTPDNSGKSSLGGQDRVL